MFDQTSRYNDCDNVVFSDNSGRTINYKKRRFVPIIKNMTVLQTYLVTSSDRLDLIAAKTLGDPEQFWKICDLNNIMYPPELETVGKMLSIGFLTKS